MSPSVAQPWCRKRRTAASSAASSVVTAPPSPVVTILRGWNERHAATPSAPHGVPRYCAPSAPAASSRSTTSCGTAVCSASHSTGRPKRCTAMTARVPRRDRGGDGSDVEVERVGVDVDEHRLRAAQLDGVRGRRERVGGDDHLVARADLEREQGEMERGGAGRDGRRVGRPDRLRDRRPRTPRPSGPS